jgi:hypothetical protein
MPEVRGMCLPWGNAVTDAGVDGRLSVQVRTVEVNAIPAPIVPRDGAGLDGTRGNEVIIVATATAIGITPVDIPTAIVPRTTTTRTTDRRDTAISSRPTSVTTATRRVRRNIRKAWDIGRTVAVTAVAVIGVWSTACCTWGVLISMVSGIA